MIQRLHPFRASRLYIYNTNAENFIFLYNVSFQNFAIKTETNMWDDITRGEKKTGEL